MAKKKKNTGKAAAGRKGGWSRSPAKQAAARKNGLLGGRPLGTYRLPKKLTGGRNIPYGGPPKGSKGLSPGKLWPKN